MLLETLLATLMLTKSDIAALQGSKLSPNATNNIAALSLARPVVLARATYATYQGGSASAPVIMSFYLDAGVAQPGDQFAAVITGTASNNTGAPQNIYCNAAISQGGVTQLIGSGFAIAADTAGTAVAWRSEITFGVNVPGADGQYITPVSPSYKVSKGTPRGQLPRASIGFAGEGHTFITNTGLTGAVYAGGAILAVNQSNMQATKSQLTYSSQTPIQIDINLNAMLGGGANWNVTVQSGYLLGL
jgi:hypothetical protein